MDAHLIIDDIKYLVRSLAAARTAKAAYLSAESLMLITNDSLVTPWRRSDFEHDEL